MSITVRLGEILEAKLRDRFERGDLSDFIRKAVEEKLEREPPAQSAYEAGKHLFGKHGSGRTDLSSNRKAIIREKLYEKHRNRRRTTD